MSTFYARYPVTGGTGVTSLNTLTGALTLIAGTGITITPSGSTITIAASGGPFANTSLSNLTTTAINQSLIPDTDEAYTIGNPSFRFSSVYTSLISNGFLSIDMNFGNMFDSSNIEGLSWTNRSLRDNTGAQSLQWLTPNEIQLHASNSITNSLLFYDQSNGAAVGFRAPASVTTSVTWILPPADGTSGQVLSTNGTGTLTWVATGSALTPPLEQLHSYTPTVVGTTGTFLGNNSNADQSQLQAAFGSTDSAVNSNNTSAVFLTTGSVLTGNITGAVGALQIQAGDIFEPTNNFVAGTIDITAGTTSGTSNGGSVNISAGGANNGGNGGGFAFNAGGGTIGGSIGVGAGQSSGSAQGGSIILTSGGSSGGGLGGDIIIQPSSQTTTGRIQLQDNSGTITAGNVWTATDTIGSGHWAAGSTSSPGGSNGQVQFNSSGTFGGDAGLNWDNTNKRLGIGTATPTNPLEIVQNNAPTGGLLARFSAPSSGNAYVQVDSGNAQFIQGVDTSTDGFFGMLSDHPLSVRTNNVTRMTFSDLETTSFTLFNFYQLASDPTPQTTGDVYYNTTSNTLRFWNGATWQDIGAGVGSFALTDLSNLTPTAINQDLTPATDLVSSLGNAGARWNSGFFAALLDNSDTIEIDLTNRHLVNTGGVVTVDWGGYALFDSTATLALTWETGVRNLYDNSANPSVNWNARITIDSAGQESIDWSNRALTYTDGTTVVVDWTSQNLNAPNGTTSLNWASPDRVTLSKVIQLAQFTTDPGTASAGDVYFNTTVNKIKVYSGTSWETVTSV